MLKVVAEKLDLDAHVWDRSIKDAVSLALSCDIWDGCSEIPQMSIIRDLKSPLVTIVKKHADERFHTVQSVYANNMTSAAGDRCSNPTDFR